MTTTLPDGRALIVRDEAPADHDAARGVEEAAFGRPDEALLVDALREHGKATLSLVAVLEGRVVGHILFSPMTLEPPRPDVSILALGPVAVHPDQQRRGVGSALVLRGLERCRSLAVDCVILVGHEDYYPRFGFVPAAGKGLRLDDSDRGTRPSFQVIELRPGVLDGSRARAVFAAEFDAVS